MTTFFTGKVGENLQFVPPSKRRRLIYEKLHSKMGHLVSETVYQLANERVFWPKMEEDIIQFVTRIWSCFKKKPPHIRPVAPLETITTTQPMEIPSIDFLRLAQCSGAYEHLLVVTDHFTVKDRHKSSPTVAERLFTDSILRFGIPTHILHDQSKAFDNKLFHNLTKLCIVKQLRTTPYHPQTNGAVKRMSSTTCCMLKIGKEKTICKDHINKLIFVHNCTNHSSTGYSPYHLLFGYKPRLLMDLTLDRSQKVDHLTSYDQYLSKWEEAMKQGYSMSTSKSKERKAKNKNRSA